MRFAVGHFRFVRFSSCEEAIVVQNRPNPLKRIHARGMHILSVDAGPNESHEVAAPPLSC